MCSALMLLHCNNNGTHCKINAMCIAVMPIHYKSIAKRSKINYMCIALMPSDCTNDVNSYRIHDMYTPPQIANRRPGKQRRPTI